MKRVYQIKRVLRAIVVWGIFASGAAVVVADDRANHTSRVSNTQSNTQGGIAYSRWLANNQQYGAVSPRSYGSFVITKQDDLLSDISDIGTEWRHQILSATDIREDMRAFARAILVGQEYDWQATGESKWTSLSRQFPQVVSERLNTRLSRWGDNWALRSGALEQVNVELRTDLGAWSGYLAVDAVGGLRESDLDALAWQTRGLVKFSGEDKEEVGGNLGLIWRRLVLDGSGLLGVNSFLDYETVHDFDFFRWSYGLEGQVGPVDFSANRYVPITKSRSYGRRDIAYTSRGLDVQYYVNFADIYIYGDIFLDVAAGLTYYRWEGKGRDLADEGIRYGVRLGSGRYVAGSAPLRLDIELDKDDGVRWLFSYHHNFGASSGTSSGLSDNTDSFTHSRTQFYAPARREYAQRIRITKEQGPSLLYGIVSRDSNGVLQTNNVLNVYAGLPPILSIGTISVTSAAPAQLRGNIKSHYRLSLTGDRIGTSLLINNIMLDDDGALLLTAALDSLADQTTLVARMTVHGADPVSGEAVSYDWEMMIANAPQLASPDLVPPRVAPPPNEDNNDGRSGVLGGEGLALVGVSRNLYRARQPSATDSVTLARFSADGGVPPYLITVVDGHTSQRLSGISLVAEDASRVIARTPHRLSVYGGLIDLLWGNVSDRNINPFVFTLQLSAASMVQDTIITLSPVQFNVGFARGGAPLNTMLRIPALRVGETQTLSGISLTLAQYGGLPPYTYAINGPSFIALSSDSTGIRLIHSNKGQGAPLRLYTLTLTLTDAGGRIAQSTLTVSVDIPNLAVADGSRNVRYLYPDPNVQFLGVGVYTLTLSGSSGYQVSLRNALHPRVHFATLANDIYALSVLAGVQSPFQTNVELGYMDAYGSRGNIMVAVDVRNYDYQIGIYDLPNTAISRGVAGSQVIGTLDVTVNSNNYILGQFEVVATNGAPLTNPVASRFATRRVGSTHQLLWQQGGNGAATITAAVRAVSSNNNNSTLKLFTVTITDPPIGIAMGATRAMILHDIDNAQPLVTVSITSNTNTDDRTYSVVVQGSAAGAPLAANVASAISVNGTIVYLVAGSHRLTTMVWITGLDGDGRRSAPQMFELAIRGCEANKIRTGRNTCQTCAAGLTPNRNQSQCIATMTSCNDNNQIFSNGRCESCPSLQNRNGNRCEITQAFCNNGGQIFRNGACEDCPGSQVLNGNNCTDCPIGQVIVGGNCMATMASCNAVMMEYDRSDTTACVACTSDEEFNNTSNTCVPTAASCHASNQIRNTNNQCVNCSAGQEVHGATNTCIPTVASCNNNNQIRNASNVCANCPAGDGYVSGTNTCRDCTSLEMRAASGSGYICQACGADMESTADRSTCIPTAASCHASNQIRNTNNQCVNCSAGQEVHGATNTCIPTVASCNNNNQIRNASNVCANCPAGDGYVSGTNTCRDCTSSEIRAASGSGYTCQACAAGLTPNGNQSQCIATIDSCNRNNQIFSSGRCESCPSLQNRNGNRCEITEAFCHISDKILRNGACEDCPGSQVRNGNNCTDCPIGQVIVGGNCMATMSSCNAVMMEYDRSDTTACVACTSDEEFNSTSNTCVPTAASCHASNQIRNTNNQCVNCSAGQEVHRATNTCIPTAESCNNNNQIRNASNVCVSCPAGDGHVSGTNNCRDCTRLEMRAASGSGYICQACGADMESTADRSTCIPTEEFCHGNNQIRDSSNQCANCPNSGEGFDDSDDTCKTCASGLTPVSNVCTATMNSCNTAMMEYDSSDTTACVACTSDEEFHGATNTCIPTEEFCHGNNQIRDSSNQCANCPNSGEGFDDSDDTCKTCASGLTPVSNVCAATMSSCNTAMMEFDSNDTTACVACTSDEEFHVASNVCIPTEAFCHASNQMRDTNNQCVNCPTDQEVHGATNTCIPTEEFCHGNNQIRDGSTNQCANCPNNGEGFDDSDDMCKMCDSGLEPVNNVCAATMNSCHGAGQKFIATSGGTPASCMACPADMPELDTTNNTCIACTANKVSDGAGGCVDVHLDLGVREVEIELSSSDRAVMTAAVNSNQTGSRPLAISLFTDTGAALPMSLADLLEVEGLVLSVKGGSAVANAINTTLRIIGYNLANVASAPQLFTLRVLTTDIEAPGTTRVHGLLRGVFATLTLVSQADTFNLSIHGNMPSGITVQVVRKTPTSRDFLLSLETAYAVDVTPQNILITFGGSQGANTQAWHRALHTMTIRITPMGLIMAGGASAPKSDASSGLDDVWHFDTTDNVWTRFGTLPVKLREAAALIHNNTLFLIGGHTDTGDSSKTYQSTDGGVSWSENTNMALRRGVSGARPIVVNNTLYLLGGGVGTAFNADTDYVKTFNLAQLGSGAAWQYTENANFNDGTGDEYPINSTGEGAAGYHNGIMFMLGGSADVGSDGVGLKENMFSFSPLADVKNSSWIYANRLSVDFYVDNSGSEIHSPEGGVEITGQEIAVYQNRVIAFGGNTRTKIMRSYYIDMSKLSAVDAQADLPTSSGDYNLPVNTFLVTSNLTGAPNNDFGTNKLAECYAATPRDSSNGLSGHECYRNFAMGKDSQYLYLVGGDNNGTAGGNMVVRVCKDATTCVRYSKVLPWDSVTLKGGTTAPAGRFGFMLLGPKNVAWAD